MSTGAAHARSRSPCSLASEPHTALAVLVAQVAPQLLAERGLGVILAAKLIGEIAGIDRFASDARLARMAGCAPIPVSSGRTDRHRLDRGGKRQLNHAIHLLAISKITHDPGFMPRLSPTRPRLVSSDLGDARRPWARRRSHARPSGVGADFERSTLLVCGLVLRPAPWTQLGMHSGR